MLICGFVVASRGDTFTVTNTADSGAGSFRQAILDANANPGLDTIAFQISGTPPFTIALASVLPGITDPVEIDATTQPGFAGNPVIELNGAASGGNSGLRFVVGASTLRGMAINHFPFQAIELDSASNSVQGNFIGTDVTGTVARGNGLTGYPAILVESTGNLIGGTNTGDGNLISGNNDTGIFLLNANNNIVQGNLIGVTASGTTALGNVSSGVVIYGTSSGNVIGGPTAAARNIVSGNGVSGIFLDGATATGNLIQGNRIGTDISGSNAVGNAAGDGITINGATGNTVSSNLISANGLAGVSFGAGASGNVLLGNFIGTDVNGINALGNHYQGVNIFSPGENQIGGTSAGAGNLISGNVQDGIFLTGGATGNLIQGNLIGLTASGAGALHNGDNGITFSNASSNIIGGSVSGAQNVISGNSFNGISILTVTDSFNTVCGNYIGTDVTGAKAVANTLAGVRIQGCSNVVGGATAGSGNVISGNSQQGIWIVGVNGNATGNIIQGNLIGLNATGPSGLANGNAGVGISSAAGNQIGGTAAGARNVISANGDAGIFMIGPGATGNQVQGNFIGTDPSGTLARGNTFEGIYMQQAGTNLIGGSIPGAGNLISANNTRGLWLTDSSWNVIQGNFIGTAADGTSALGNTFHGIDLDVNSTNNTIGGSIAGAGNRIAFAQTVYCGVRVRTGAFNNLISGNSIFSNGPGGALGIDLSPTSGGTSPGFNPIVDCESGIAVNAANAGQNFPVLSSAYGSGNIILIHGTMDGKTGKTYGLEFFASPSGDSSGYGEGQVFLGQTNITLGSMCSSNFTVNLPVSVPAGWVVTATATDASNNTSEFSDWVSVIPVPPLQLAVPNRSQISVSCTNNGGSFVVQQTYSLTPPIQWTMVTNVPIVTNNFLVTTLAPTNGSVFYRLTAK